MADMTDSARAGKRIPLIHPGKHLAEFLEDSAIGVCRAARDIGVSAGRIRGILKGERGITPDTGLRLAKYFGQSDGFWILLQAKYDTEKAQRRIATDLTKITPHAA